MIVAALLGAVGLLLIVGGVLARALDLEGPANAVALVGSLALAVGLLTAVIWGTVDWYLGEWGIWP